MSEAFKPIQVAVAYPLEGDDFYLVSGNSIVAWRSGEAVPLEGAELEAVRRWVVGRAAAAPGEKGPTR